MHARESWHLLALEVASCSVLTRVAEVTLEGILVLEDRDVWLSAMPGGEDDELGSDDTVWMSRASDVDGPKM